VEWRPLPQAKSSTFAFSKIEVVSYVIHKELCFGIVSLFVQDVIGVSNQELNQASLGCSWFIFAGFVLQTFILFN
jgi:hypothetical protein